MARREKKKKRLVLNIVLCVMGVLFLVVALLGGSMFIEYQSSGEGTGEAVTIEIEKGESTRAIAAKLKDADLIDYEIVFYLKVKNMGATLNYGTFTFYKESGLETIIKGLNDGGALKEDKMFIVPEGYTIEMIAAKLETEGICSADDFLLAVEEDYDYWFLENIPSDADVKYRLQGFLYPDTYAIGDDMTAKDIVTVMLNQFDKKFTADMRSKMESMGKTVYEVVIEASIIEREAVVDEERPMMAGVIKNRLEIDMMLQMCPTVLYPLTDGMYNKNTVTTEDTRYDSPYNTYQNKGLPPGPIANPGLKSLEAALNPIEHDFLYYRVDESKDDGSHIFNKDFEGHVNAQ